MMPAPLIHEFQHLSSAPNADRTPPFMHVHTHKMMRFSIELTRTTAVDGSFQLVGSEDGTLVHQLDIDSTMLSRLTNLLLVNGELVVSPVAIGADATAMILLRDPPALIRLQWANVALGVGDTVTIIVGAR